MNDRAATPDAANEPTHEEVAEVPPSPLIEDDSLPGPSLDSATAEKPSDAPRTLEDRVRRLENNVAVLQDTRKLEDRITDRVARRLERKQSTTAIKAPVATIAEPSRPPLAAVAPPEPPAPVIVVEGKSGHQPWLILDIFTEFRAMVQMFLDGRYRVFYMTWQTKVYPPVLLGLMVLSWLMISGIPLVGPALDKIAELILAFFLYKVLSREACRYREIRPQIKVPGYR